MHLQKSLYKNGATQQSTWITRWAQPGNLTKGIAESS